VSVCKISQKLLADFDEILQKSGRIDWLDSMAIVWIIFQILRYH